MKKCQYCGAEIQEYTSQCPSCGGKEFSYMCENCGTVYSDGNYCPKCGVKAGTKPKKCPNCGASYFSAACPDCGYVAQKSTPYSNNTPNPNYISSHAVNKSVSQPRNTWLWVLGWIFVFIIPATVLIVRSQKLPLLLKVLLIIMVIIAWVVFTRFTPLPII